MQAKFALAPEAAGRMLRPALADWRDAAGCADPLLLPANAQTEAQLVPLPLPSWCAWLIDAGLLQLEGPPRVEGPRVVLRAALAVVREAELEGVERFPCVFAGRFTPGAPAVHLALSPPFLSESWRGPICVRAAADGQRLWLGGPASPASGSQGVAGETVATWAPVRLQGPPDEGWPSGWPRWLVLRIREGREPQALWSLPALWKARFGDAAEASFGGSPGAPVSMRLGVDLGSTSTVVIEEDAAAAGAPGAKLLSGRRAQSGFRRLAGDAATAHRFGCGENLETRNGQLPTALAAGSPAAVAQLFAADAGDRAWLQVWLPQAGEGEAPFLADRFKSPELLLLSDWLAGLPQTEPKQVSRALIEAYARHLGTALAAAHATPLVVTEGGRWALRWPRLQRVEAVLTYPRCAWADEPFQAVFDGAGRALGAGLSSAWDSAVNSLISDPVAAHTARGDSPHPIEAFVDFGGLTLQVTVRVPGIRARPAPFIPGSSMTYLLGGERVLDAAAFAAADFHRDQGPRQAFRALGRGWRSLISRGGHASGEELPAAGAIREAILDVVLPLVTRQIEATLRRAALDHGALRGAGLRLFLLGDGWKLAALDVSDSQREATAMRRIEEWLGRTPFAALELARIDKRRLCQGALRATTDAEASDASVELHGVDIGSEAGLWRRWFAVPDSGSPLGTAPLAADPWWRSFAGAEPSLLRIEQWFGPEPVDFTGDLSGGSLGFDAGRSVLKQWLDVCGASLVALRIHDSMTAR